MFFIHTGGIGLSADCFIKTKKKITEENAYDEYGIDYYIKSCPYVIKFLESNPDYQYVGSTDNMHMFGDGWGMDLSGWTEIPCPIIVGDE